MPPSSLMMSEKSMAAFGGEAIFAILSSPKIPTAAPVIITPSLILSSRFFFTSNGGVVIYYNTFRLILEIFSEPLSGCAVVFLRFVINFGIIKIQTPRANTAIAPTR